MNIKEGSWKPATEPDRTLLPYLVDLLLLHLEKRTASGQDPGRAKRWYRMGGAEDMVYLSDLKLYMQSAGLSMAADDIAGMLEVLENGDEIIVTVPWNKT